MKNTMLKGMMFAMMMTMCATMQAQHRGGFRQDDGRGNRHEMGMNARPHGDARPGGMAGHGGARPTIGHRPMGRPTPHVVHRPIVHHCPPPPAHARFIRGWEGRVCHHDGRWGYYRDGGWYYYDHYIEPNYYYSRPLSDFGAGVVIGTVAAAIIGALVH